MTPETLAALAVCAFASTATPGPNNALLMASGLSVGVRRSLPFVLGINAGLAAMLLAVGLGLGAVLEAAPGLATALKAAGAAFLLLFAWRLATCTPAGPAAGEGAAFGFWGGAAFQAVNPKAWVMAVGAVALYAPAGTGLAGLLPVVLTFLALGMPANLAWVAGGSGLSRLLSTPARMRAANRAMAALLVLAVLPVVLS